MPEDWSELKIRARLVEFKQNSVCSLRKGSEHVAQCSLRRSKPRLKANTLSSVMKYLTLTVRCCFHEQIYF